MVGINPDRSKETRMEAQSAKIADGRVFLPEDAPWKGEFREELLAFPAGSFTDQVDSMSQFLAWTDSLPVKVAEMGLVFLLSVHLLGGLRLLAIEFLPWRDWQKPLILLASGVSALIAFLFVVSAA